MNCHDNDEPHEWIYRNGKYICKWCDATYEED